MIAEVDTSNREAILQYVRQTLVELFEIEKADVTPQSRLYDDLDIDSIDAVDLVVELKKFTGKRIEPQDFKNVRTVEDVINAVEDIMQR